MTTAILQNEKLSFEKIKLRASVYWSLMLTCAKDRKGNVSDLLFSGISHAFRILVFSAMYRVAFGSSSDPKFIAAIWAVSLSQTMFSFDRPPLTITMGEEIKDGTIAVFLLRPISYIHYSFFSSLGKSFPSILTSAISCFSVAYLITSKLPSAPLEICITLLTAVSGVMVMNILATTWGLLGFWTQETSPYHWIDHKMSLLFGGLIIPLALLPDRVQSIVQFTPWSSALAQPGKLLSDFTIEKFWLVVALHVFWFSVIYCLASFLMYKGTKKLVALGG